MEKRLAGIEEKKNDDLITYDEVKQIMIQDLVKAARSLVKQGSTELAVLEQIRRNYETAANLMNQI